MIGNGIKLKYYRPRDFPGSPVGGPSCTGCLPMQGAGLILGWRAKMSHVSWAKNTKSLNKNNVKNSVNTLKIVLITNIQFKNEIV